MTSSLSKSPDDFNYSKEILALDPADGNTPLGAFLSAEGSASRDTRTHGTNGANERGVIGEGADRSFDDYNRPKQVIFKRAQTHNVGVMENMIRERREPSSNGWPSASLSSKVLQPADSNGFLLASNDLKSDASPAVGGRRAEYVAERSQKDLLVSEQQKKLLNIADEDPAHARVRFAEPQRLGAPTSSYGEPHSFQDRPQTFEQPAQIHVDSSYDYQNPFLNMPNAAADSLEDSHTRTKFNSAEDYESYVVGLRQEHGRYQDKLRELQNRIKHLNQANKPRPDIAEQDREYLWQASQELEEREKKEKDLLSDSNVEADDVNTLIRREEQLGALQKSIDTSNYSKVSDKHALKLKSKEEEYKRLDQNSRNTTKQLNAEIVTSKIFDSDKFNRREASSPRSKLEESHFKYEPLRMKVDQDGQSPQVYECLRTLKTLKTQYDEPRRSDAMTTQAYINQVVENVSKKQAESDISMSDFRRQRNDIGVGRDCAPSVGDIKHFERATAEPSSQMPSYDPADLFAKPEYKTKLARREQEQRASYRVEPANFHEADQVTLSIDKPNSREDSNKKHKRKLNQSNHSNYLRTRKNETLAVDEPPKYKLSLQQRSRSAKRSMNRSESRTKMKNVPKIQSVETPQQNHRRISPKSTRSTGKFKGIHVHQKLGIGLVNYARRESSHPSKKMPRLRSEASGHVARNNDSMALDEQREGTADPLAFKNSRLQQLEKKFDQQKMKSKDRIDHMQQKIEQLLHVNQLQQSKIKKMTGEKSETLANVGTMHEKLNLLNQRLTAKNELYRAGKEKNHKKIDELEERIEKLMQRLDEPKQAGPKELPYQRHARKQRPSRPRSRSKRDGRSRSKKRKDKSQKMDEKEPIKIEDQQRGPSRKGSSANVSQGDKETSAKGSHRSFSHPRVPSPPTRVDSEEVQLKVRVNPTSPKHDSKHNNIPFVPLRNPSNKYFAEKKIRPQGRSTQQLQDTAEPEDNRSQGALASSQRPRSQQSSHTPTSTEPAAISVNISSKARPSPQRSSSSREKPKEKRLKQVKQNAIKQTKDAIGAKAVVAGGRTMTHSSSKSQMTFGDKEDFATVRAPDQQVAVSPYEDLQGPSRHRGQTAAPGQLPPDSQEHLEQKHPSNVTITISAEEKNGAESYELIGEQLVSPERQVSPGTTTTLVRNPFVNSHQGSFKDVPAPQESQQQDQLNRNSTSGIEKERQDPLRQDDRPLKYSESQKYPNGYNENGQQPLAASASAATPTGNGEWPSGSVYTRSKDVDPKHQASKIHMKGVSPLRGSSQSNERSSEKARWRDERGKRDLEERVQDEHFGDQGNIRILNRNVPQSSSDAEDERRSYQPRTIDPKNSQELISSKQARQSKEPAVQESLKSHHLAGAGQEQLTSLVLELANQVKGLKEVLGHEIEGKKEKDQQLFGLQDRYFKTLDELKQDLGDFKQRMEQENKQIKEEFWDYKRTVEMQQTSKSRHQSWSSHGLGRPFDRQQNLTEDERWRRSGPINAEEGYAQSHDQRRLAQEARPQNYDIYIDGAPRSQYAREYAITLQSGTTPSHNPELPPETHSHAVSSSQIAPDRQQRTVTSPNERDAIAKIRGLLQEQSEREPEPISRASVSKRISTREDGSSLHIGDSPRALPRTQELPRSVPDQSRSSGIVPYHLSEQNEGQSQRETPNQSYDRLMR